MIHAFSTDREPPPMVNALFVDHSSGGLFFVEIVIDDSFGVSFDLRVEPALETCYYFIRTYRAAFSSGCLMGCLFTPVHTGDQGRSKVHRSDI